MPYLSGSLLEAMEEAHGRGVQLAVLCIDEQGATHGNTKWQVEVLARANALQIPIWLIELNPALLPGGPHVNLPPHRPSNPQVTGAAGPGAHRLRKGFLNAFLNSTLEDDLRQAGVTTLVIMGQEANCCVRATAVGGVREVAAVGQTDGAVQRGFTVMTSQWLVVSGEIDRQFGNDPDVFVYAFP